MAKKKSSDAFSYFKRYYGLSKRTKIDYSEALGLVKAVYPEKDAKAMLTVPNTIRCKECIVHVEVENVALIKGAFEVVPEEGAE